MPILHLDMDAFYASVEMQADPSLVGRPVIVGGTGPRGVVASCSYEARAYGVRSAMPSARARRLCPEAVFLAGRFGAYAEASRRLHAILTSVTPMVEGIALDEAFLDVGGAQRLLGSSVAIAHALRRQVGDEMDLACSVGVGRSKLMAKLASKAAKPTATLEAGGTAARAVRIVPGRGVFVVPVEEELAFLHPLPVSALWGVGPATEARLGRLGIATVGQLAEVPLDSLVTIFGRALGAQLYDLAMARDPRAVESDREVKSIGHEQTYAVDHVDLDFLGRQVVRMSDAVASRARAAGRVARTVTIKVRFADFTTITRSHTHERGLADGPAITRAAGQLLAGVDVGAGVRLLGVSLSGLIDVAREGPGRQTGPRPAQAGQPWPPGEPGPAPSPGAAPSPGPARQLSFDEVWEGAAAGGLFPSQPGGGGEGPAPGRQEADWSAATAAVDAVRARFGEAAVGPAVLASREASGELDVKRAGDTQWGPSTGDH